MSASVSQAVVGRSRSAEAALQVSLIVAASLFVAVCARLSLPIPGTPVPLSMQNFAVLLVGLALGSRRGFMALALYLAEGAAGLPVFAPGGALGILRFAGPTAGYLLAYPFVAGLAGWVHHDRVVGVGAGVGPGLDALQEAVDHNPRWPERSGHRQEVGAWMHPPADGG